MATTRLARVFDVPAYQHPCGRQAPATTIVVAACDDGEVVDEWSAMCALVGRFGSLAGLVDDITCETRRVQRFAVDIPHPAQFVEQGRHRIEAADAAAA